MKRRYCVLFALLVYGMLLTGCDSASDIWDGGESDAESDAWHQYAAQVFPDGNIDVNVEAAFREGFKQGFRDDGHYDNPYNWNTMTYDAYNSGWEMGFDEWLARNS